MRRIHRLTLVTVVLALFPASVFADDAPETLELADGRFRVALEWAEEPAGELWTQDLGGEGGMFGATDGGEAARLEVAEIVAGKVQARYRVDERVAAFVVTHIASGVTRRIEVSAGGVLELDPAAFAAEAAAKVTPVLDTARAVSAFVGPDGGSVTATNAGGVAFTLTLPKGALLTFQEITVTPLLGLGGFPFTPGFVAGVLIEPEGLRLWKISGLKIEAPTPVPQAEEVTFGFRAGTNQLFLAPAALGPGLSLKLTRLAGFGVGRGTSAELAAQGKRVPTRESDRLDQKLALALANQRRELDQGPSAEAKGDTCDEIVDPLLQIEFNTHLAAGLKKATKSCSTFRTFLRGTSTWSVHAATSTCAAVKKARARVQAVYRSGLVKCFNESFGQCTKPDTDGAHELLGAYRLLKASGWQGDVDAKKIEKCVRFDFNFSSSFDITSTDAMKERLAVESKSVPLRQSGAAPYATASGVATWVEAKCLNPPDDCTCTSSPNKPAQLVAHFELHGSQLESETHAGSDVYEEWFSFGTTAPSHNRKIVCDGTTREDSSTNVEWYASYWTLHTNEIRPVGVGILWLIRDFSGTNPAVYSKVYVRPGTLGDSQVQENTSLFLSHKPQP